MLPLDSRFTTSPIQASFLHFVFAFTLPLDYDREHV